MSTLSAEMAFEVGDIVYFKTADHTPAHHPRKFIVTERFIQQCHGGIQRLYKLGGIGDNSLLQNLVPEIELSHEPPPYDDTHWKKAKASKDLWVDERFNLRTK